MLECLDNIIGLSETTCECFDTGKPSDYNTSNSGIWLDQLEGFKLKVVQGADDCADGGLWDRMERAVRNAKTDLTKDLLGYIGQTYKPRAELFKGLLGDPGYKSNINVSTSYVGIKVMPLQIKGGVIILKRIGVLVSQSVNVTVKVYSNESGGTLIASYTTSSPVTANNLTWITLITPLELPMWSYTSRIDYFVMYELDGTYIPKNNKKDCGCGGSVAKLYRQWLDFTGTKGNDTTALNSFSNTSEINGLILDLEIKCKTAQLICNEDERPLDFENDSFAQYLAYAVRFKAAEKLYRDLLSTDVINRYTMLDREYVNSMIIMWGQNYIDCINYLGTIINIDNNDCLICRDQKTLFKYGIKA